MCRQFLDFSLFSKAGKPKGETPGGDKQLTAAEELCRFTSAGATLVQGGSHKYFEMMLKLSLARNEWK